MTVTFCLQLSCNYEPIEVTTTLSLSGDNRSEIEKVIKYFKGEGNATKLKAAYYLIAKMKDQYHPSGTGVKNYDALFRKLVHTKEEDKKNYVKIWDSLKTNNFPRGNIGRIEYSLDVKTTKARFLINHINAAFIAWQQPWTKDLTFDEFCEWILPYKLADERPNDWMDQIQHSHHWLIDSMKGNSDAYKACLLLNEELKQNFKIRSFPFPFDPNFAELDSVRSAKCVHATQYTAYLMRAMGVPIVMDFTQYWGNLNGGHQWNALIYHHKPIPFVGSESDPGKTKIELAFQRRRAKVFRRTFTAQSSSLPVINYGDEDVPVNLNSSHIADVTDDYVPVSDVTIRKSKQLKDANIYYLFVFNKHVWRPIFWGVAPTNSNSIVFRKMGRNILYLPGRFNKGKTIPISAPFILDTDGKICFLNTTPKSNTKLQIDKKSPLGPSITKGKSYELFLWNNKWTSLAKVTATGNHLNFDAVAKNGLYWIHSSDKATNERIFTIKNGKQVWW
ncbi:hypothetical protein [Mucilaginibacter pocheonensis]|uniref:Transglutaminase domain-containing protein n=1 Tax=Mucilaginibacter pocheonensis TaxID=398050 RepID=A0ABU1TDK3_9SPHI|nr:hypothetical protein [Mucilaginibacter pocheonensis]MDR6942945.1 hypothetical protein [Mucilaginibacter pocheonensis]